MSKISDVLNKNNIEESSEAVMTPTAVDQMKVLKAYKNIYKNLQELNTYSAKLTQMFPEPIALAKLDTNTNVGKFLFQHTRMGTAKITDLIKIDQDLSDVIDRIYDIENNIDRQCDSMGE